MVAVFTTHLLSAQVEQCAHVLCCPKVELQCQCLWFWNSVTKVTQYKLKYQMNNLDNNMDINVSQLHV